jgi:hypothetical protein
VPPECLSAAASPTKLAHQNVEVAPPSPCRLTPS